MPSCMVWWSVNVQRVLCEHTGGFEVANLKASSFRMLTRQLMMRFRFMQELASSPWNDFTLKSRTQWGRG